MSCKLDDPLVGLTSLVGGKRCWEVVRKEPGTEFLCTPQRCAFGASAAVHANAARGSLQGDVQCVCCSVAEASAETLREMNPLVRIAALPGGIADEPEIEYLGGFDVVLLVQAPLHMQLAYDKACTDTNTAFFTACSRGTISYFFENLHVHEWTPMVSRLAAWLVYRIPLRMPHPWRQPWTVPGRSCWVAPTLNTHTHKILCLCC